MKGRLYDSRKRCRFPRKPKWMGRETERSSPVKGRVRRPVNENMRKLMSTFRVLPLGKIVSNVTSTAWRPDLKIWHRLFASLISVVRLVEGRVTRGRVVTLARFSKDIVNLFRKQGSKGTCLYLKTCSVMLMQSTNTSALKVNPKEISGVRVSASGDGLPRLIPRYDRVAIRKGSDNLFRFWLTLFGLYRVIDFPGRFSVKTIVRPGKKISESFLGEWRGSITLSLSKLSSICDKDLISADPELELRPKLISVSTSASNSVSGYSSFAARKMAAYQWINDHWGSALWQYLWCIGENTGTQSLWNIMMNEAKYDPKRGTTTPGRLSTKLEAAGKVRVFAMVDYWTQVALNPLHDYIMGILREIPQDGTFDQTKPVKELLARIPTTQKCYSFDLSAATDRLSVELQEILLAKMFTEGLAWSWRKLLCDRTYKVPKRRVKNIMKDKDLPTWVRYSQGQPMGAYSSWAMLALTHHMIVQMSAQRTGEKGWFRDYAVLGDDLVIANDKVAAEYRVICRQIDLGIGIAKSIVSANRTVEFAKKFFVSGKEYSPFPWKLFGLSRTLNGSLTSLQWVKERGAKLGLPTALLAFGFGQKSAARCTSAWNHLGRRAQVAAVLWTHPNAGTPFIKSNWISWLLAEGPCFDKVPDENLVNFAEWSQVMYSQYILPLERRIEEFKSAFLFDPEVESWVENVLGQQYWKKVMAFEDAWTKSKASLIHLQRLGIRLQARQASAVFTQIVRLLENRLAEIPLVPTKLNIWKDREDENVRLTQVFSLWRRWRDVARRTAVESVEKLEVSISEPETREVGASGKVTGMPPLKPSYEGDATKSAKPLGSPQGVRAHDPLPDPPVILQYNEQGEVWYPPRRKN